MSEPFNGLVLCTGNSVRSILAEATAHCGVPDPAAAQGTRAEKHPALPESCRKLGNRVSIFGALPMQTTGRLALQRRLDAIGRYSPEVG